MHSSHWLQWMCLIVGMVAVASVAADTTPEQVVVTYLEEGAYSFTWVTQSEPSAPSAVAVDGLERVTASVEEFLNVGVELRRIFIARATVHSVPGGKTLAYRVGSDADGWSPRLRFRSVPEAAPGRPLRLGVYGDMGLANPVALPAIKAWSDKGLFDMILHVGDFAYDLHNENGLRGDAFMRMLQPVSSQVPYQTCPGNHELDVIGDFHQYRYRFTMPNWANTGNMYHSFDVSNAHIIAINTEAYFDGIDIVTVDAFYSWLEADLKAFNASRSADDWLIVFGHRPFYCSDSGKNVSQPNHDCSSDTMDLREGLDFGEGRVFGLEDLFHRYRVDVVLSAHEHNYERMLPCYKNQPMGSATTPYVDPPAPIYIISGAAGCPEQLEGLMDHPNTPCSVVRVLNYGFGVMTIHNGSALEWQQYLMDGSTVVDAISIQRHGA